MSPKQCKDEEGELVRLLPKSLEENHQNLSKMNIQTGKGEDLLKMNDVENGLIIFKSSPPPLVSCQFVQTSFTGIFFVQSVFDDNGPCYAVFESQFLICMSSI